jgi:hypothetical protein
VALRLGGRAAPVAEEVSSSAPALAVDGGGQVQASCPIIEQKGHGSSGLLAANPCQEEKINNEIISL